MAYTKNTWNNGDVITAEKLNHMEDGITDSDSRRIFPVLFSDEASELNGNTVYYGDKTAQEVIDAMNNDCFVVFKKQDKYAPYLLAIPFNVGSNISGTGFSFGLYMTTIYGWDFKAEGINELIYRIETHD